MIPSDKKPDRQERERAATGWSVLIFGLIGAAATIGAVTQLRRSFEWFYTQLNRSQSTWRNSTDSSGHRGGGYREEVWRRYKRRMQEEHEEEMERVELHNGNPGGSDRFIKCRNVSGACKVYLIESEKNIRGVTINGGKMALILINIINIINGMTGIGRLIHLTKIKEQTPDPPPRTVENIQCRITTQSWVLIGQGHNHTPRLRLSLLSE